MNTLRQLVSNYYSGELVSLGVKVFSTLFFIAIALLLKHYWELSVVQLFANNVIVLFGLIFAKSTYQWVQYYYRKKRLLHQPFLDGKAELVYVEKREAILTNHRRFHVYFLFLCFLAMGIIISWQGIGQYWMGTISALFLLSGMLLSFSLFNSFRLSEYKYQLGNVLVE